MAIFPGIDSLHFSANPSQPLMGPQKQIKRKVHSGCLPYLYQIIAQERSSLGGEFVQVQQFVSEGPDPQELPGGIRRCWRAIGEHVH
jgi:hypothetical protein